MVHHNRKRGLRGTVSADVGRALRRNRAVSTLHAHDCAFARRDRKLFNAKQSLLFHQDTLWDSGGQGTTFDVDTPSEPPNLPIRTRPLYTSTSIFDVGHLHNDCPGIRLARRIILGTRSVDIACKRTQAVLNSLVVHVVFGKVSLQPGRKPGVFFVMVD